MSETPARDSHVTSATLLLRLKSDGPAKEIAWQDFYSRYAPMIGGFARKMGTRHQDIDDLIHEVLLGFFAVSPTFVYDPARGRFRGYLKTCVWRTFRDRFAKGLQMNGRSLDSVGAEEPQIEAAWNDVWESEKLQRAVDRVRQDYLSRPNQAKTFRAFELYVLLERPAEDVAVELGMDVNGVHQAKRRITQRLRETYSELDEEVG